MLDFIKIKTKINKDASIEVFPEFISNKKVSDVMIRGGAFYAIWDEALGLWSTDEYDVIRLVDNELWHKVEELKQKYGTDRNYIVKTMSEFSTSKLTDWKKYLKASPDLYHELDSTVTFRDDEVAKEDYVSKRLPYSLSNGPTPCYDTLMNTLYSEEERDKIEWAVGSILTGDSRKIQKFLVLYGEGGIGKGTVLRIVEAIFQGYTISFNAKSLTSSNNQFALSQFRSNPLVAIQFDGKLNRIEDNTLLNSLVAHEPMTVNEKYKAQYDACFSTFLFMGTNSPVAITDAKSGLIRRLIDVQPTGKLLQHDVYDRATNGVKFELGAIAQHCIDRYKEMGISYYDKYKPTSMFSATNDMYNFVYDNYDEFNAENYITLKHAWTLYKDYVEEAKLSYPMSLRVFKSELANYFEKFTERARVGNGERIRNVYQGFKTDKFQIREDFVDDYIPIEELEAKEAEAEKVTMPFDWLNLDKTESSLDYILADCPAQYAKEDGTPEKPWDRVTTKLRDLDTSKVHYILLPSGHIIIDLDLKDEDGNKSMKLNLEYAKKFPPTYAEFSKSGGGIHLHYIYDGDVNALRRMYDDNVEIKVYRGNASLRRRLSYCNDVPIATISSGLPTKGDTTTMLNVDSIKSEAQLRSLIKNCLAKKHHGHTTPEVNYIFSKLEEAYSNGVSYDVTDLRPKIRSFALNSHNQPKQCMRLVGKMRFKSKDFEEKDLNPEVRTLPESRVKAVIKDHDQPDDYEEAKAKEDSSKPLVIFDIEVFQNLLLICWKKLGKENPVMTMINPTPQEVSDFVEKYRLIGFNCRGYDNHILYARILGNDNMAIYKISQSIIDNTFNGYGPAYRISEADIYDICKKKQGLKKWEIELAEKGLLVHHQELGFRWDEPVPEDQWGVVAEYCANDVIATEAVWDANQEDVKARMALAKISGLSINERNRAHAARIIFGNNKSPKLVYTKLATGERSDGTMDIACFPGYEYRSEGFDHDDYISKVITGKSMYKKYDPGEGGFVYAEPGIHRNVALLDIASMHPSSIIALNLFGEYTQRFKEIVDARLAIKHRDTEKLKTLLGGALMDAIGSDEDMDILSDALKLVINSVYGFTTATFDNPFKDPRNVDNIVAKRGALFMVDLKEEVQKRGYTVAHIKTDSIKIPNATPEIIEFVMEFGKKYGYNFEHEATYEKMCLMNDAVYIAKYDMKGQRNKGGKHAGEWTATGKQFQVPYVFKSLFSHEPIEFKDLCETRSVSTAMYLDMNEQLKNDEHNYIFVGRVGQFCPIKPGCGGGELLRESKERDKFSAVGGTKEFRWLESETVKTLGKEDDIDREYYKRLVDRAVEDISKLGNFESFVSEGVDDYVSAVPFMNAPETNDDEVPF